nr:hypothetical protein CFP56_30045 [Quercus suber]
MGLLKHFRSRARLKDNSASARAYTSPHAPPARGGRDFTSRLPANVLGNILTYVCPHSQDTSYEPSERSQIGDGCMLCDLRDLASCAQVCRKWYGVAQALLYKSVRIDAVHYCALEEELAERRKKQNKHFRNKSHLESGEVPNVRLSLLCRTLREQNNLAVQVLFLKLPYMTRETAKGDLARTVAVLPNLRYVDLPDGFFTGDPSCIALRQELQMRCPDIRKMTYRAGSEEALELLTQRYWQAIEILELSDLAVEPATLRIVLASLPTLHELTLSALSWMDDSTFQSAPGQLPDFPPLQSLKLEAIPNVTAEGLGAYLRSPQNRGVLSTLSLQGTGITVTDLHSILWAASSLQHLSITETVSKSLGLAAAQLPALASISLKTMHFEITSSEEVHGLQKPAESYYLYLCNSLHQNALPALETLYVRDQSFPELLLLTPMPPSGPGNPSNQNPNQNTFTQTLEVFSKGIDELEWVFTSIVPPSKSQSRMSTALGGRPLSAYSASRGLGPQWAQGGFGGEARKSVMVGNGFGGFLAVPQDQVPRPMTADGPGGRGAGAGGGPGLSGLSSSAQTSRLSFFKPPPSLAASADGPGRRGSKHDLWR